MPKRDQVVPLFTRLVTPDSVIYVRRSKDCHSELITTSLQGTLERPLKDTTCDPLFIGLMIPENLFNKTAFLAKQYRF